MMTADVVRGMKGRRVRLSLAAAGGGGDLEGLIVGCLESADGLVVYLDDPTGHSHTIHYQHIAELTPLEPDRQG